MEYLNSMIGKKLKEIRVMKGLSLEDVAKLTGVSKAMLGQIERGVSNPTVSTLWKIATGLKVSFSFFIEDQRNEIELVEKSGIQPIMEENGQMNLFPFYNFQSVKNFEIFQIELEPGCKHCSLPHSQGVEEYIFVIEGELIMEVSTSKYTLTRSSSLRFDGNVPHTYSNNNLTKVIFMNLIYYKSEI